MPQLPYQFFNEFVVRTPTFPLAKLKTILKKPDKIIEEIDHSPLFLEALYLASPDLYDEVIKWKKRQKEDLTTQIPQHLKNTLLKYFIRMSTRCTPFGMFAGVDSGHFSTILAKPVTRTITALIRESRLDMHFLIALAQYLSHLVHIKDNLLFYPNNSIYLIGNKIRYIEYEYRQGKRDYFISSAPLSAELGSILKNAQKGLNIKALSKLLINDHITKKEALEFIEELIRNQILISELEPNVSGEDFLEKIILFLQKIKANNELLWINKIKEKLKQLDLNTVNSTEKYKAIEKFINRFPIIFERKYLIQTDLYYLNHKILHTKWKKKLQKAIGFLNKITQPTQESTFIKFKNAFSRRFEMREMPLTYIMDPEIGIGYLQNIQSKGLHPYIEDLTLPETLENKICNLKLSPLQQILNQKLQYFFLSEESVLQLQDKDFSEFSENWTDLPDTMSFMSEIITDNGEEKLIFTGGGGSSGANLVTRFCSEKHNLKQHVESIIQKEESLNPDVILAEIIHLPQSRIGNILRRPTLRKYEIPYLAKSTLQEKFQIPVDDLYISIKQNQIVLRSKSLNKEIKPMLSNAHNYSADSLPVYYFLCDILSQNKRPALFFSWGDLEHIYHFLPRVEYNGIILSKARWKIFYEEIQHLCLLKDNSKILLEEIKKWQKKRRIPDWVTWSVSDNKLAINLQNYSTILLFLETLKPKKFIMIEEFFFHDQEAFTHEYIFTAYKTTDGY
ncbi:lantibiotic dehydratase [Elizabethkingia anophelis]|nr:lantibiotic dehydratase [Elizabethkingia anophelis]